MEMEHVRRLASLTIGYGEDQTVLLFTRSFLADSFKGQRLQAKLLENEEITQRTTEHNNKVVTKPIVKVPVQKKTLLPRDRVFQSTKYFTSVSYALQALQHPESSSSSDSSEDERNNVSQLRQKHEQPIMHHSDNGIFKNGQTNQSKLSSDFHPPPSPNPPIKTTEYAPALSDLDDDEDLVTALSRLGLPACFGTIIEQENGGKRRKRLRPSNHQSSEDRQEEKLLWHSCGWGREIDRLSPPNHHPRRQRRQSSTPPARELLSDPVNPSLRRWSSDQNLTACYQTQLNRLCKLLELACVFTDRVFSSPVACNLEVPRCWNGARHNRSAWLTRSKQHWRLAEPKTQNLNTNSSAEISPLDSNLQSDPVLSKYWAQRYRLFSRFDDGIQMDREGFFSVTPEVLAAHQARRIYRALVSNKTPAEALTIVDVCAGTGANSIQLALLGFNVIAVEIDPTRIEMAAKNAQVYGVLSRIQFVCADFFHWALLQSKSNGTLPISSPSPLYAAVFISPPWGGPDYSNQQTFDLTSIDFTSGQSNRLWMAVRLASGLCGGNVALLLPRNTNMAQITTMAHCIRASSGSTEESVCQMEIETNMINSKVKTITIYSGLLSDPYRYRPVPMRVDSSGDEEWYSDAYAPDDVSDGVQSYSSYANSHTYLSFDRSPSSPSPTYSDESDNDY